MWIKISNSLFLYLFMNKKTGFYALSFFLMDWYTGMNTKAADSSSVTTVGPSIRSAFTNTK